VAIVYFRKKSTPSGVVLQLVESSRNEQGMPRQHILASLGGAAIPEVDWPLLARHVAAQLAGQNDLLSNDLSPTQAEQVDRIVRQAKRQKARCVAAVLGPYKPIPSRLITAAPAATAPKPASPFSSHEPELDLGEATPPHPSPNSAPPTPADVPADATFELLENVEHSHATSVGAELVGLHAWDALQLTQALVKNGFNQAQIRCAQASVLNRLVEPVSEHALGPWLENVSSLPDLLGDSFHGSHLEGRFLRVSDLLYKNEKSLESHLRNQQEQHFGPRPAIFLYDLTNTYFEGQAAGNTEAKHGHSKEKRNDCPLVSIALAYSQNGLPLGHKIFAGNQNDATSFPEALALLETEWKDLCARDQRALFVFDCGIATAPNLLLLRQKGYDYLVSERRSLRADFEEVFARNEGFTEITGKGVFVKMETTAMPADPPLPASPAAPAAASPATLITPEAKAETSKNAAETTLAEVPANAPWAETRLFCKSEARANKEQAMLAKACERLEVDLQKLSQRVQKGNLIEPEKVAKSIGRLCERHSSVMRYYEITPETQSATATGTGAPIPPTIPPAAPLEPISASSSATPTPTPAVPSAAPLKALKKPRKTKLSRKKPLVWVSALRWKRKPELTPEALCGAYCLRSNRNFDDAAGMWALYTGLTAAEDGFRCLKSDLGLRPVRHQIKERVHAHIFISIIALHLLCFIKKRLADAGEPARTWTTLKHILRSHAYVTLSFKSPAATHHLRKIGIPNAEQKRIYDRLGIRLADCPVSRFCLPAPKK